MTSSSDAQTIASSDEDDANLLEAILGSAFSCDPSWKSEKWAFKELTFIDKDLLDNELKASMCICQCASVCENKRDKRLCLFVGYSTTAHFKGDWSNWLKSVMW